MFATLAGVFSIVGLLLLVMAIVWDLVSLYLILVRIRTGVGPSAVPLISWLIYFLWLIILKPLVEPLRHGLPLSTSADRGDLRLFGALTLLHLLCQWVVPEVYRSWQTSHSKPD
jgi:hypothetical protein